ncbi:MAG: methylmalonyl-CoA mutase [Flavobacterium sp.]|nr:methylmalonyl-CoA mutase [Flavobacterium sp.]
MSKPLFSDFEAVSSKQWKQQIQFELKGAEYNDTVVWDSPEGIRVKPFYHQDADTIQPISSSQASACKIGQAIFVFDLDKSIARAKDTVTRGAESLHFKIDNPEIDCIKLLTSIADLAVPIHIQFGFLEANAIQKINEFAQNYPQPIAIYNDPIGYFAREGNWHLGSADNFELLKSIEAQLKCSYLSIDAALFQNAGANMVQQIAYSLGQANEYFNRLSCRQPLVFQWAVGSNYFFEIAKLRAFRSLFKLIAQEYNHTHECHIVVTPSKRNKTIYDYNVNMLRTTTECMSAILGGADTIINLPYDALYHKDNEFGDRIARNQLLILKHESYLDKVDNPADGSYYIESLTQQLAEKSLTLFQEIESQGGFLQQLKEGVITRKIQESSAKEQALFDEGKTVLLGTNKHPNKADRMKHDLELFPFVKIKGRKTLITPIIEKRLAEHVEQERLQTEK